ncbi:MAG: SRPBCC family protein [Actinobacteria bacterium]|nr:SRPBCC family protein [Actinomycetota bacterium]
MRRECQASIVVEAPATEVWDVVSDVTRVGEWSGECRRCEWVGGAAGLAPGARFRGTNRRGMMRWARLNEVDVVEAPHELVWHTVFTGLRRDSTEWRVGLRPTPEGTEVTESFRIVRLSRAMERFFELVQPAHRDRSQDLADDLARLKSVVEAQGGSSETGP